MSDPEQYDPDEHVLERAETHLDYLLQEAAGRMKWPDEQVRDLERDLEEFREFKRSVSTEELPFYCPDCTSAWSIGDYDNDVGAAGRLTRCPYCGCENIERREPTENISK